MTRSPAIVLLAAIGMAALTARLGWWQLDRAAQKTEIQRTLAQRQQLPPLAAEDLARHESVAQTQAQRSVQLRGRWSNVHTVYLDNRQMGGRPGFFVLTPLLLNDGSAVLVQRGWQPRDFQDRSKLQAPTADDAEVTVVGRIAMGPSRLFQFENAASGVIRQNLELAAFATETRLRLRPLTLLQLQAAVGGSPDALQRDWPQPAADVHKHYGYAFQWFALSALTIALYVWFQFIAPRRRAQR